MTCFWVLRITHIFEAGGDCDFRNITTCMCKTKFYFIRSWLIYHCCILISSSIWLQLCLMSYYKCINQISFISRSAEKNVDANTSAMLNVALGSAAEGREVNQNPLWCLFSIINKKHQQAKEHCQDTVTELDVHANKRLFGNGFQARRNVTVAGWLLYTLPSFSNLYSSEITPHETGFLINPIPSTAVCDAALTVDLLMTMCSHWILTASVLIDKGLPTRHCLLRCLGYT